MISVIVFLPDAVTDETPHHFEELTIITLGDGTASAHSRANTPEPSAEQRFVRDFELSRPLAALANDVRGGDLSSTEVVDRPNTRLEAKPGYTGLFNSHKYWGKKPSELYELIFDNFAPTPGTVVDPFLGSGVAASVALSKGLSFLGCDLNPIAIEIADVFVNPPDKRAVIDTLAVLQRACANRINDTYRLPDGTIASHHVWRSDEVLEVWVKKDGRRVDRTASVVGTRELAARFDAFQLTRVSDRTLMANSRINISEGQRVSDLFTKRALLNIESLVLEIDRLPAEQRRIARFCLSSSLGQMSKMVFAISNRGAATGVRKTNPPRFEVGSWVIGYWRPDVYFEINVWGVFEGRVRRLANALGKQPGRLLESLETAAVRLECGDALSFLSKLQEDSIDLVVTDPPHSDRIPYLELSEMWNTFLGHQANFRDELIFSNSSARDMSQEKYLQRMGAVFHGISTVLKSGGFFILIFNVTEKKVWNGLRNVLQSSAPDLCYYGRFAAEYSAGSVVQDNREGSLRHDWCLVFRKSSDSPSFDMSRLPMWDSSWT